VFPRWLFVKYRVSGSCFGLDMRICFGELEISALPGKFKKIFEITEGGHFCFFGSLTGGKTVSIL